MKIKYEIKDVTDFIKMAHFNTKLSNISNRGISYKTKQTEVIKKLNDHSI